MGAASQLLQLPLLAKRRISPRRALLIWALRIGTGASRLRRIRRPTPLYTASRMPRQQVRWCEREG